MRETHLLRAWIAGEQGINTTFTSQLHAWIVRQNVATAGELKDESKVYAHNEVSKTYAEILPFLGHVGKVCLNDGFRLAPAHITVTR